VGLKLTEQRPRRLTVGKAMACEYEAARAAHQSDMECKKRPWPSPEADSSAVFLR